MRASDLKELFSFLNNPRLSAREFVEKYVHYHGLINYSVIKQVRRSLKDKLVAQNGSLDIDGDRLINHDSSADIGYISQFLPDIVDAYFREGDPSVFRVEEVLSSTVNEWQSSSFLPSPLNIRLKLPTRPALNMMVARRRSLFVSPYGFQYFCRDSKQTWKVGHSRCLSGSIEHYPTGSVSTPLVVIQDQFDDSNFAHFLYDCVPRIILFATRHPAIASKAKFVMGGIRTPYHELVLGEVSKRYGLPHESFWFPTQRVVLDLTGDVFMFSDTTGTLMHPLAMCHPDVLPAVRSLLDDWRRPSSHTKKLYVTRKDSSRRRVGNEAELTSRLDALGFTTLNMSLLNAHDQIELLTFAEQIVAPHGMGLTNIVFNRPASSLVEMFTPKSGTDTYAFVARALGLNYQYYIGEPRDYGATLDFDVDVEQLLQKLEYSSSPCR